MLKSLIREPLVHFLILGAGVFGLFALAGARSDFEPDEVVVGAGHIERMSQAWRKTRMRPPTQQELEGLIEDFIKEEIYYREAMILGLDNDNPVIRRHLRQKMEFLTDTGIYLQEPSTGELEIYFTTNQQVYRNEPRLAFEQIYLGEAPAEELVSASLKRLLTLRHLK